MQCNQLSNCQGNTYSCLCTVGYSNPTVWIHIRHAWSRSRQIQRTQPSAPAICSPPSEACGCFSIRAAVTTRCRCSKRDTRRHPRWRTRIKRDARHGSRGPPPTPPPRSRAPSRGAIRIPGGDRQGVRRPTPQRLEAAACGARLHGGDRRQRRGRGRLLLTETRRGDQ